MVNKISFYIFMAFFTTTCMAMYFIALIVTALTKPFDKRMKILHIFTSFWGVMYIYVNPMWHLKITGKKNIDKNETYIVVSNHQSQLDILAAFGLYFHYKWVSKLEIFKIPFIGWNMTLNRYIPLKRGDKKSIEEMLDVSRERLKEGSSVYFFPEGTRSADGVIKDFKIGAFSLAHEMKKPILPISIWGTMYALPKLTMQLTGRQLMYLSVMEPIPYEDFANLSVEETASMVQGRIVAKVKELSDQREREF